MCKFKTLEKDEIFNHVSQKHPVEDLEDDVKLSESSGTESDEEAVKSVPAAKRVIVRENTRSTSTTLLLIFYLFFTYT